MDAVNTDIFGSISRLICFKSTARERQIKVTVPFKALVINGMPPSDESGDARAVELVRAEFEDFTWQAFWRVAVDGQRPGDVAEELSMTVHAVVTVHGSGALKTRGS